MIRPLAALFFLLGLGWSMPALAWGDGGHRAACEIAMQKLTPRARAEVVRLLGAPNPILAADGKYAGLGWACTYPDHVVEGGPPRRSPEHYVTVSRTLPAITDLTGCPPATPCVLSGIAADYAVLGSKTASDADKAVALAFLGHFVADVHMPLHASFADDKEGGAIDAVGLCETSLHWAWDNCIFEARIEPGNRSDDDIARIAARWIAASENRDTAPIRSEPWQWANESYTIARLPWLGYCTMLDDACQYASWLPEFAEGQPHRKVMFDERYLDNATPIVAERLTLAGLRLADLLNRSLDPEYR